LLADLKVKHFLGVPPEITRGTDDRILLPPPKFLLIQADESGTMLFRLAEDGAIVGDTWHASYEEAISQVAYEYGNSVGEWVEVPEVVTDVMEFAHGRRFQSPSQ